MCTHTNIFLPHQIQVLSSRGGHFRGPLACASMARNDFGAFIGAGLATCGARTSMAKHDCGSLIGTAMNQCCEVLVRGLHWNQGSVQLPPGLPHVPPAFPSAPQAFLGFHRGRLVIAKKKKFFSCPKKNFFFWL